MAVPETADEIAADASLDAKLSAFLESETADTPTSEVGPADEPVDEPQAAAEAEVEPEVEPESVEDLLAGKYRTPEELAAAYKELESRLGSQGQELGELRKQLEESFDERFNKFEQTAAQTQLAASAPSMIQDAVDEGRYQDAASYALQSRNDALYMEVMNQWAEQTPYSAYAFDASLRHQDTIASVDARIAAVSEPLVQQTTERAIEQAVAEFAADKPDLGAVFPEMMKVAESSGQILGLLESNDPQTKVEVLDYLYTKARGRLGDTLAAAQQQAADETQQAARQAKTQATVGNPVTASQAKPKTPQDGFRDEFRKILFDDSTSIRSGLTSE